MRFETRTSGVFEVLGVHLDADQTFDAGRLRQETLRLVEKGSRRIVVDLGQIDYLYSDSINAFVALNRRMLESSGRLGILVPHPKVHEILVRAGLENIMRLYRTEAELLGDSRELMRQSSAWTRPAELSSAASASQILSATNLIPRTPEPSREGNATQRIPRRRSGPRVELKTRRHDGRRQDQPSQDDAPLPPPLPGVGSESSSLRALSRESSSFGPPTPRTDWTPPAQNPPAVLPSVEPTVFQLPQDPEQDGYSTDAWLLALTNQPVTEARRKDAEQDSSGFLPKLDRGVASPSQATEDNPPSQLDTGLRWEEEIPLTDGPGTRVAAPVPAAAEPPSPPAGFGESPFASAFLDPPPAGGTAAKSSVEAPKQEDALRAAIFHGIPSSPEPARPPAAERSPLVQEPSGKEAAEPTIVMPSVHPSEREFRRPSVQPQGFPTTGTAPAEDWFGSSKRSPVPTAPPTPVAAPKTPVVEQKSASPAEDWFGSSKRSPAPTAPPTPVSPPKAPAVEQKSASPVEDWFGSSKRASAPTASPVPVAPAPSPVVEQKSASPVEDWFNSSKRTSAPAHSPEAEPSEKHPTGEQKPSSPEEDWFAQPAPRVMASASDRPSETDAWFGNPTSPAKGRLPAVEPRHPPRSETRPARKSALPPLLDEIEPRTRRSKRKGMGFWIVVAIGTLLVVGGLALWFVGFSDRHASDLPPVTMPAAEAPPAVSPGPPPSSTTPEAKEESVQDKDREASRSKPNLEKKQKAPTSAVVAPAPAPPPVEDHAPVKVFVTSRPSGAALSLDGKGVGTTPCEITVVRPGTLAFALSGYRTLQQAIDPDEVRGTLNVQLLSDAGGGNTGRIYISSAPSGADIVYGGKTLGKTPKLVELPTGSQKLTVKSGVQSQTKTLDILSGTNPAENFSL